MTRIVVGVDVSPAGAKALEWAVREAVARDLPLVAARAWLPPSIGMYYPAGSELAAHVPDACTDAEHVAAEQLKLACERVLGADRVESSAVAVMGAASEALVELGKDAAVLVVGTRGAGVFGRTLVGSVSSSVAHHATCPVAVVPEGAPATAERPRVLVGVDHSPESLAALQLAVEHARRHGAVLAPVFVHEPVLMPGGDLDLPALEACERQSLISAARTAGATDLLVEPEVLVGRPADVLTRTARPQDVLVVGSRGRGGFVGLVLGSSSTQALQHATCPVIVVRRAHDG